MKLSSELHDTFRNSNASLCCRVLTRKMKHGSAEHVDQCVRLTGEVAAKVAGIIEREQGKGRSWPWWPVLLRSGWPDRDAMTGLENGFAA